jgi:hypothetical protein
MQLSRSKWKRSGVVALALLALLAVVADGVSWLGSTLAARPALSGNCAVLVLGYPSNADGSPNPVQRARRGRAGLRALRATAVDGRRDSLRVARVDPRSSGLRVSTLGTKGCQPRADRRERRTHGTLAR